MATEKKARPAPWRRPNPKRRSGAPSKKLSPEARRRARARAAAAGRRYPNLVDNMWAAKNVKDRPRSP